MHVSKFNINQLIELNVGNKWIPGKIIESVSGRYLIILNEVWGEDNKYWVSECDLRYEKDAKHSIIK